MVWFNCIKDPPLITIGVSTKYLPQSRNECFTHVLYLAFLLHLFSDTFPETSKSKDLFKIEDHFESLILRVSEKSSSALESNLEELEFILEANLGTFGAKTLCILSEHTLNMPEKYTIYTTLADLLNALNYN